MKEMMVNEDEFFVQDDWEFQLDCIPLSEREALEQHLKNAPQGHPTALFLKDFMRSGDLVGFKFTSF